MLHRNTIQQEQEGGGMDYRETSPYKYIRKIPSMGKRSNKDLMIEPTLGLGALGACDQITLIHGCGDHRRLGGQETIRGELTAVE